MSQFYVIPVNPEPWVTPPYSTVPVRGGKHWVVKAGRDNRSHTFKEAVREELERQGVAKIEAPYRLHFLFYRKLDRYQLESGKKHTRHDADATNMQKLLEDALQGYLIDNDTDTRLITSQIVEQGSDAPGLCVVIAQTLERPNVPFLPGIDGVAEILAAVERERVNIDAGPVSVSNEWGGGGDF